MNERQRQDYLEAMGIQAWFPRFVLPAAKPSPTCDWDFDDYPVAPQHPQLAPQVADPSSHNVMPQVQTLHSPYTQAPTTQAPVAPAAGVMKESSDILGELGFSQESDSEEKDAAATELQPVASDVIPAEPFRLAVIDVSDSCLVVTDLPWSGVNQFTGYHERLLRNILRAVNIPADQELQAGVFAWPIIPDATPVDRKYAKEAVRCFLTNQFGLQRRKTILLFGRSSSDYLWDYSESFEECRGVHSKDGVNYAITCSLGEMMGIPELKAEAWANIKRLRKTSPQVPDGK
ncbi:hypothetical protein [Parendozoicomonas sp. Alg238-R29]|uniref:hypothetical protein n=1 Tax=Parendozoicomonas sp. Alg238-R29 TaxID=2993446 RepID=UPI00248E05EA|nr:hypothetical protein [Parendozoicomonas sp. Alg238-R29]